MTRTRAPWRRKPTGTLDRRRLKLGWTVAVLAERASLPAAIVGRVLHGQSQLADYLTAIRAALRAGERPDDAFGAAIAASGFRFDDVRGLR